MRRMEPQLRSGAFSAIQDHPRLKDLNPNTSGEIHATCQGIPNLLIRWGLLTSPNDLAVCLFLPRAGSVENGFDLRLCVAPIGLYNTK